MKKLLLLLLLSLFIFSACKDDDEQEQETSNIENEFFKTENCTIQLPNDTNFAEIGEIVINTGMYSKSISISATSNKSSNTSNKSSNTSNKSSNTSNYSSEVTVSRNGITLGNITNNEEPLAYTLFLGGEVDTDYVLFSAEQSAIAIVFMHPFFHNIDINTAHAIKERITQMEHFDGLVVEILQRMRTGSLNVGSNDFDPSSFDNYKHVIIELEISLYENTTVNQNGIEIINIVQNDETIKFKIKNTRKRWLKVVPSFYNNGNTTPTNFHLELLNLDYPFGYVGSLDVNILKEVFINGNLDLTSLNHVSHEYTVNKENAEQLFLDIYGVGLTLQGEIHPDLLSEHYDVVIISVFQDFVLPVYETITGLDGLHERLRTDINIVGRPLNDPYKKMLERLVNELDNPIFKDEIALLISQEKYAKAIKKIIKKSMEFVLSDNPSVSKNLYDILKVTFGEAIITQTRAQFKAAIKNYIIFFKVFDIIDGVANIGAFVNTVMISDWHTQKNIIIDTNIEPAHTPNPTSTSTDIAINGNLSFTEGTNTPSDATYKLYFDTSPNPTTLFALSSGITSHTFSNLQNGTSYYWKVETISNSGSVLATSPIWSFTTLSNNSIPTVTTTAITNITQTTATSGGNVTNEGGSNVTEKGIIWSTSPNPTITDNPTADGIGIGNFTSSLIGLTENTIYYVKAYATNSFGTAFGTEIEFTTGGGSSGTFTGTTISVTGGTFTMGSPSGTGSSNEHPQHSVTLSDFSISKYEITNQQYADYMNAISAGSNGSVAGVEYLKIASGYCQISHNGSSFVVNSGKANHPVIMVSWYGAKAYSEYYGGRLPTEAEWEFAAKGGNSSNGYIYSGSNTVGDVAWYVSNSGSSTHTVGTKNANELGLHDMSGNVSEWINDWYDSNYYSSSPSSNPQGPSSTGVGRVARGGCWNASTIICRVVNRGSSSPTRTGNFLGFRPVFVP